MNGDAHPDNPVGKNFAFCGSPGVIVDVLTPTDRFILAWTYCHVMHDCMIEPGQIIPDAQNLLSYVHLFQGTWSQLSNCNGGITFFAEGGKILEKLGHDLDGFDQLCRDDEGKHLMEEDQHTDMLKWQRETDSDRLLAREPILLPPSFLLKYAPRQVFDKPALRELKENDYKHVSGEAFQEHYAFPFRLRDTMNPLVLDRHKLKNTIIRSRVYTVPIVEQVVEIDRERGESGYPILLPKGFRLWRPGLLWNGAQSYPADLKEPPKCFKYASVCFEYVELSEFNAVYHLRVRPNTTPMKMQIACDFCTAFQPIFTLMQKRNDPCLHLAEAICKCHLDGQTIASLQYQRMPKCLSGVIEFAIKSFTDLKIGSEFGTWINEQMAVWVGEYHDYMEKIQAGSIICSPNIAHILFQKICSLIFKHLHHSVADDEAISHEIDISSRESLPAYSGQKEITVKQGTPSEDIPPKNPDDAVAEIPPPTQQVIKKGKWTIGMPKTDFVKHVNKLENRRALTKGTLESIIKRDKDSQAYKKETRQCWRFNLENNEFAFLKESTVLALMGERESGKSGASIDQSY